MRNESLNKILKLLPFIIVGLSLTAGISAIQEGHEWGGDFAQYIEQSIALSQGNTERLFDANTLTVDNSDVLIGPYLYPPGFPVLLLPVYLVSGINFIAMKWLCAVFFAAALLVFYKSVNLSQLHRTAALMAMFIIAFHGSFITFADKILSDFPFLFFVFTALYLMPRMRTRMQHALLGLVLYAAYMVRDPGIVLLPAFLAIQSTHAYRCKVPAWTTRFIPYAVFGLLTVITYSLLPFGTGNHIQLLLNETKPYEFYLYYRDLFAVFLTGRLLPTEFLLIPFFLIVTGMWRTFKAAPHFTVFTVLYTILIIFWPSYQNIRLLFPVLPLLVFFMAIALTVHTQRHLRRAGIILSGLYMLFVIANGFSTLKAHMSTDSNTIYTAEMQDLFAYISSNTPTDALIVFENPRALRLFTNRNALSAACDRENSKNASFALIRKNTHCQPIPGTLVFESANFKLIQL